jgi:hypothetical protein
MPKIWNTDRVITQYLWITGGCFRCNNIFWDYIIYCLRFKQWWECLSLIRFYPYEVGHFIYICCILLPAISNDTGSFPSYVDFFFSLSPPRLLPAISNDTGSFPSYVDFFFSLSPPRLLPDFTIYMSNTAGVL